MVAGQFAVIVALPTFFCVIVIVLPLLVTVATVVSLLDISPNVPLSEQVTEILLVVAAYACDTVVPFTVVLPSFMVVLPFA